MLTINQLLLNIIATLNVPYLHNFGKLFFTCSVIAQNIELDRIYIIHSNLKIFWKYFLHVKDEAIIIQYI